MKRNILLVLWTPFLLFQPFALAGSGAAQPSVTPAAPAPIEAVEVLRPVFKSISPAAAAEIIEQKKDLLIVDVRTPQERKQFRIADSLLVPVGDVMRGKFRPEADRPVLVICSVGGRSYIAGKVMTARGHREVYNLDGGIESWRKAGLPLTTGPEPSAGR